jgi:tetraacyldisaccharide 4'-kinase
VANPRNRIRSKRYLVNEANFKALVSGEKRGVTATLLRGGLRALSLGYTLAATVRNRFYDWGVKTSHQAGLPVVSVGNITTGGTGKTPMVAFLANWFKSQGLKPVILSRGYRAVDGGANDEKLVLDLLCPGVPHLQNPDRVTSATIAVKEHQAQVLVLDDGFQHRRLARDLNLLLIDATNPWGYGAVLPRGLLREPLSGIRRADFAILTRADQVTEAERDQIRETVRRYHPQIEMAEAAFVPTRLVRADGTLARLEEYQGQPIAAFCGIGNPWGFRQTLEGCRLPVGESCFCTFPDHHHYGESDMEWLGEWANKQNALALITTQKDLVKIPRTELNGVPLWAVEIGIRWQSGEELLLNQLRRLLPSPKASGPVDGLNLPS